MGDEEPLKTALIRVGKGWKLDAYEASALAGALERARAENATLKADLEAARTKLSHSSYMAKVNALRETQAELAAAYEALEAVMHNERAARAGTPGKSPRLPSRGASLEVNHETE